jgi:OOP family OmpA-OmpF porin
MKWKPKRWAIGLPLLAAVWGSGTWLAEPVVEADLKRAAQDQPGLADLRRFGAKLEVQGRDAIVTTDFGLADAARSAAQGAGDRVPGLRSLRIETATPLAGQPFRLTILRRNGGTELRGSVPAGGLHGRLIEQAGASVGPDKVEDRLVPAIGAPDAYEEAAEAALRLAAFLERGEVTLADRRIAAQGEAADFAGYNALIRAATTLPAGYTLGLLEVQPPEARPFTWSASRNGSAVTLSGYVPSESARDALREALASALPGASVTDEMQTARGLASGVDFGALTRPALDALGQLGTGRALYDGRQLALSGSGPARDQLDRLPDAVRRNLPRNVALGPVSLTPVPASPYLFTARRGEGRVSLSGYAPDEDTRDMLQKTAERRFVGEAVSAGIHIADGAPDGFASMAGLALETLSQVADGEATLSDRRVNLEGRALYSEAAEQTRRRVTTSLPSGWTGTARLKVETAEKILEPGQCADLLGEAVRREPVRFEADRPDATGKGRAALDALASVVRRCGSARIRVVVRADAGSDADASRALAQLRATALAGVLGKDMSATLSGEGALRAPAREGASPKADAAPITFLVEP